MTDKTRAAVVEERALAKSGMTVTPPAPLTRADAEVPPAAVQMMSTNIHLDAAHPTEQSFATSQRFSEEAALEAFAELAPGKAPELLAARSPRTWLQYRSAVHVFQKWCAERGRNALPASAETFCRWVEHMIGERRTIATIASYRGAIAAWHRLNGHRLDATMAGEWMRAARRRSGPPRRAAALRADHLRAILAKLDPAAPADCRDGALLLLAWGAALRSDEVTALDWMREGPHHAGGKGAVVLEDAGVRVVLRRAKTTQASRVEVPIPHDDLKPLQIWLKRWTDIARIAPGTPLFRPFRHGVILPARLGSPAVTHVLRRRALGVAMAAGADEIEARIEAGRYTSHSPRRGLITEGVEKGVPFATLRRRSRHRSDQQLVAYVDDAQAWTDSGIRFE